MAPLTDQELQQVVAASPLQAKYGTTVDRESAHEIITARLAAAHQAAMTAAGGAAGVPGAATGDPNAPYGGMTKAQYEREIRRQATQAEKDRQRELREAERERKAQAREAKAAERQRERTIETGLRTAGRLATSSVGQSILRGVFGTIFGGKR
jgi:hypothetical protein